MYIFNHISNLIEIWPVIAPLFLICRNKDPKSNPRRSYIQSKISPLQILYIQLSLKTPVVISPPIAVIINQIKITSLTSCSPVLICGDVGYLKQTDGMVLIMEIDCVIYARMKRYKKNVGDEFHCILQCKYLANERKLYPSQIFFTQNQYFEICQLFQIKNKLVQIHSCYTIQYHTSHPG